MCSFQKADMAMERQPIDYLIEALSQDSQDNNSTQGNRNEDQSSTINLAPNNISPRTPSPMSPATIRRNCRLARILRTSSLKKRIIKHYHCQFCPRFRFSRAQMEAHLKESQLCLNLYLRLFKVNEMEAVLVKIYKCLSCSLTGNSQLKRHLGRLSFSMVYLFYAG